MHSLQGASREVQVGYNVMWYRRNHAPDRGTLNSVGNLYM